MTEPIRSRSNPFYKRLLALKDRASGSGLALLEGPKLVEEALLSRIPMAEVAAAPRAERSSRGRRLVRELRAAGVPIRELSDELLESLSEAEMSQGLLALAQRPVFEEERFFDGVPLILVAVRVQDPGNLGGLLRTAEAAGATGAYLTEGCADPFSWKALRGSMGSALRLPHRRAVPLQEVMERLRGRGVRIAATASEGALAYHEADLRRPLAVCFGNEGSGLPDSLVRDADLALQVPVAGRVESLNVGVSAGIVLFEAARQRREAS